MKFVSLHAQNKNHHHYLYRHSPSLGHLQNEHEDRCPPVLVLHCKRKNSIWPKTVFKNFIYIQTQLHLLQMKDVSHIPDHLRAGLWRPHTPQSWQTVLVCCCLRAAFQQGTWTLEQPHIPLPWTRISTGNKLNQENWTVKMVYGYYCHKAITTHSLLPKFSDELVMTAPFRLGWNWEFNYQLLSQTLI